MLWRLEELEVELSAHFSHIGRYHIVFKGPERHHRHIELDGDTRRELIGLPAARRVRARNSARLGYAVRQAERIVRVGAATRESLLLKLH